MSEPEHLCQPFIERTRLHPDAAFATLVSRGTDRSLTNRWVLERALAIGEDLRRTGVASGDLVVIVLDHCADLYTCFIGCLIGGYVPAFMPPLTIKQDPEIFRRSMKVLFARIEPAAVVTSLNSAPNIPAGQYSIRLVDDIAALKSGLNHNDMARTATHLINALPLKSYETALLQHSSGTTGLKKGVMLSHASVLKQIYLYADSLNLIEGDVIASWLPLYHDMGLITCFLMPLVVGNMIVSLDALEWVGRPTMLLDYMDRFHAAFAWLPNFAFHHILRGTGREQSWDLTAVKAIVNCSEPCRANTFDLFSDRFACMGINQDKLLVCYAMAENVFAVTQTKLPRRARPGNTSETRPFLSCGEPLAGIDIVIRASDGTPITDGETGEICIRSITLFHAYFRQPEITNERLRDGWFHTNDLGCLEHGELFVLGRVDDLVIVNGKNLFAHEIEQMLSSIAGVAPGRALAYADFDSRSNSNRLLILAEAISDEIDTKPLEAQIRQHVLAQTGIFPGAVRFLPRGFLVKSSSGKIARAGSIQKYKNMNEKPV